MNKEIFKVHKEMDIELFKLKVINGDPLLFPQRYIDNGDPTPMASTSNLFEEIFEIIKNDNQFYISLFKNYNRYLIDVDFTLGYTISSDNKSAFQILFENYKNCDNYSFPLILSQAISNNSNEIIQHLITNDHFKFDQIEKCNSNYFEYLFFSNGKCESRFFNDNLYKSCKILNSLIESNKFNQQFSNIPNKSLKERFKEDITNLKLNYLIESCKTIILLNIKQDINNNNKELTMEELMKIKNKFTIDQLNSNVISLPNSLSLTILKRLSKFYYFVNFGSSDFNSIFYYLKFEDDQFDYSQYTYGGNISKSQRFNDGCSFGSWRYLKFINLPNNEKQLSFRYNKHDCLFKYSNSTDTIDQIKRIEFINQVLIQNLIEPITLISLLIVYGDIELLNKAIGIINNKSLSSSSSSSSILKSKFNINNYINTTEMLNYCWLNFKDAIIFDIANTQIWFEKGRFDLMECFESLSNIQYKLNNPKIINYFEGRNNFYGEDNIKCILKLIERENQLETFNYDPDTILRIIIKTLPNGLPFLKEIILLLDNHYKCGNQYRYNPLLFTNTPNSIHFNKYHLDFINWVLQDNRKNQISSGKCSFSYIPKWYDFSYKGQTKSLKSLYYIVLYKTGRIDQMLKGIDYIGSIDLIGLFISITEDNDISTFDKLMNLFNSSCSLWYSKIEKVKKDRILLVLENATSNSDIRVFQHIFTNYKGYLQEKGTPNNSSKITEDEFYNSIFKQVLIADHILLYDFFYKYLNYTCITKFTVDDQYNSVIYHNYSKHSSSKL